MNKPAAIYARVSSDRQKENHTIASQTAALIEYAQTHEYSVPPEWIFQDEGYSGAVLVRPGLEALRDLAAEGQIGERCRRDKKHTGATRRRKCALRRALWLPVCEEERHVGGFL